MLPQMKCGTDFEKTATNSKYVFRAKRSRPSAKIALSLYLLCGKVIGENGKQINCQVLRTCNLHIFAERYGKSISNIIKTKRINNLINKEKYLNQLKLSQLMLSPDMEKLNSKYIILNESGPEFQITQDFIDIYKNRKAHLHETGIKPILLKTTDEMLNQIKDCIGISVKWISIKLQNSEYEYLTLCDATYCKIFCIHKIYPKQIPLNNEMDFP